MKSARFHILPVFCPGGFSNSKHLRKSVLIRANHLLHFFVEIRLNALRFIEYFILSYGFRVSCFSGYTTGTLQNVITAEGQELVHAGSKFFHGEVARYAVRLPG